MIDFVNVEINGFIAEKKKKTLGAIFASRP